MKPNLYYVGFLAAALLVLSGPASFATPTDQTPLTETTDETETSPEGIVTVAVGEGSNETVQYYTFTPQSVEINAGESVTWFTPAEFVEFHTVTFFQDPSVVPEIALPFAPAGGASDFELLPPFNLGEPILIPTPDGREAILALNKHAFYPAIIDANNQATFPEGTDIQATLNSTVKAINSGIIFPSMPPMGGPEPNSTEAGTLGGGELPAEASIMNETTTTTNATTMPDEEGTPLATEEGGEQPMGPPFPLVDSFTVTFEEPGTYEYLCALHPWMTGEVVVQGDTQTETQTQPPANETTTTTPDDQDVPLSDPDADRPTTPPEAQTETPGAGEQQSPNPIFG